MNEMYWITRLDAINVFFTIIAITAITAAIFVFINGMFEEWEKGKMKKYLIPLCVTTILSSLLLIFIPSTKEALIIYGVGGTIDYVKENDQAKEIPDKAIKALDAYLDKITKENNNGKGN